MSRSLSTILAVALCVAACDPSSPAERKANDPETTGGPMPWIGGLRGGPTGGVLLPKRWVRENSAANVLFVGLEPCRVLRAWEGSGSHMRYDVLLAPMPADDVWALFDKRAPSGSDGWDGHGAFDKNIAAPYAELDHLGVTITDVEYGDAAKEWRRGALQWVGAWEKTLRSKASEVEIYFFNEGGKIRSNAEVEIDLEMSGDKLTRFSSQVTDAGFTPKGERKWSRTRGKWKNEIEVKHNRIAFSTYDKLMPLPNTLCRTLPAPTATPSNKIRPAPSTAPSTTPSSATSSSRPTAPHAPSSKPRSGTR